MRKPSIWLACTALVLVACSDKASNDVEHSDADPFRLSGDIVPLAQQVHLDIDPEQEDYSGSTTITVEVRKESADLRLHAKDMEITSLALSRGGDPLDVSHRAGEHALLIVAGSAPFVAGTYELHIEFSNNFNDDGVGINRTEQEGRHYIFSQFEAIDARQAFPCFDEPGFKFPWQLSMTVPAALTPITNTPELSVSAANGMKTVVFDTTPPLPSYLIAVAVGLFDTVPIAGMSVPGRVVVPRGKSHLAAAAVETTPPLLAYLEDYFGEPYPFKKLDLIATNQAFSGAMEHPGAITYSDFFLLLDDTASEAQKTTLIKITAHELAHQWFGNLVTMQWWNDLWLNESFADWLGDKASEAVYPQLSGETGELRTMLRIMNIDAAPLTKPIRHDFKATDNFEDGIFLSYYKGKAVLGMFEEAIGPDVFRDGVVRYIRAYSRKNARAADLWAEINAGAEFDLAGGLAGFIDQPGIPLVSVESLGDGQFRFAQSRMFAGAEPRESSETWVIPLTYKYRVGNRVMSDQLVIDEASELVELDPATAWVLPNADQKGYYRWTVPGEMMASLSRDAADYLNVRERMGLISNVWALLASDKLDGDDYYAAIRDLAADSDPAVLQAVLDQLNDSKEVFITPELRPAFAKYLRDILNPALDRIGVSPASGEPAEVTELRARLLQWLADDGRDPRAGRIMDDTTTAFLAGDIPASSLVGRALRSSANRGGLELFTAYQKGLEAAKTPGERRLYVVAMASFTDSEVVKAVLDHVLSGSLQPNDIGVIFGGLADEADNNAFLLAWAKEHDAAIRQMLPDGSLRRAPGMLMLCSAENVDEIVEFYGAPERFVQGIENELREEAAEKKECAAFRRREQASVRHYLDATT